MQEHGEAPVASPPARRFRKTSNHRSTDETGTRLKVRHVSVQIKQARSERLSNEAIE
jgi:hypothetical protein